MQTATPEQIDAAHPRSRGENASTGRCPTSRRGSSPLTRGKRHPTAQSAFGAGLIPAHAGKTRPWHAQSRTPWAHPRSRGENRRGISVSKRGTGSSPLTRGKRYRVLCGCGRCRLIPAHAGKTHALRRQHEAGPAHPRSRGENAVVRPLTSLSVGSSPLTRGKPGQLGVGADATGLIPAHAGKTLAGLAISRRVGAHPRSRGENAVNDPHSRTAYGSSPLTRGKLGCEDRLPGTSRLIPAHAGKTSPRSGTASLPSAHPRSRGENRSTGFSSSAP